MSTYTYGATKINELRIELQTLEAEKLTTQIRVARLELAALREREQTIIATTTHHGGPTGLQTAANEAHSRSRKSTSRKSTDEYAR